MKLNFRHTLGKFHRWGGKTPLSWQRDAHFHMSVKRDTSERRVKIQPNFYCGNVTISLASWYPALFYRDTTMCKVLGFKQSDNCIINYTQLYIPHACGGTLIGCRGQQQNQKQIGCSITRLRNKRASVSLFFCSGKGQLPGINIKLLN